MTSITHVNHYNKCYRTRINHNYYAYIINFICYFFHENIFVVDKDKDNITPSVQIGYQK